MNYEEFWRFVYPRVNRLTDIFVNAKEWDKNYFNGETGYWQLFYKMAITDNEVRSELFLGRYITEENKALFDELFKSKAVIEDTFGGPLLWERHDDKKLCRICVRKIGFDLYDKKEWPDISDYLLIQILKLSNAMRKPLEEAFRL